MSSNGKLENDGSQPLLNNNTSKDDIGRAFVERDIEASRKAHDELVERHHLNASSQAYVKSFTFGALDGLMTCFAIVASIAGGDLDPVVVLVIGAATLIAGAISMGFGDYLSEKAEQDLVKAEYAREMWETENYLEGEIKEMKELYIGKGMSDADADIILQTMSKYPKVFVDTMMMEELGMLPPDDENSPWKTGCVMFISFFLFGAIPLIAFIATPLENMFRMIVAAICTILTIFMLGWVKGAIIGQNGPFTGIVMAVQGVIAAGAAYGVAYGIDSLAGSSASCIA